MSYKLYKLAPGSYDLALNGVIIGSVVQDPETAVWIAELLLDSVPQNCSSPFTQPVHEFGSFEEIEHWLGRPSRESEKSKDPSTRLESHSHPDVTKPSVGE